MNAIWIILAALSFIGSQVYLFRCLKKQDKFIERKTKDKQDADRYRNSDGDMLE